MFVEINMLPKKFRLKKNSAFKATYNARNSVSDEFFIIFAGKKKSQIELSTKIGFVVSKKNHKRAVKRNRLKRLMRETFRLLINENSNHSMNNFLSLVVVARDKAIAQNYQTISKSLLNLCEKLK